MSDAIQCDYCGGYGSGRCRGCGAQLQARREAPKPVRPAHESPDLLLMGIIALGAVILSLIGIIWANRGALML